jgi:hypothetical protein
MSIVVENPGKQCFLCRVCVCVCVCVCEINGGINKVLDHKIDVEVSL